MKLFLRPNAFSKDRIYTNVTRMSSYPRHAQGPGYVLSPDLARYIAELEERIRS